MYGFPSYVIGVYSLWRKAVFADFLFVFGSETTVSNRIALSSIVLITFRDLTFMRFPPE